MKKLTMATALKQARDGRFEFTYDEKIGINEVVLHTKDGRRKIGLLEIVEDKPAIEAYGSIGMDNRPFRKTFKSADALEKWMEKHDDADVLGTREKEMSADLERAEMFAERQQKLNDFIYHQIKEGK